MKTYTIFKTYKVRVRATVQGNGANDADEIFNDFVGDKLVATLPDVDAKFLAEAEVTGTLTSLMDEEELACWGEETVIEEVE